MSLSNPANNTVLHSNYGRSANEVYGSSLPFAPGLKGWEQIAACRGIDASIFFPDDEDDNADLAKEISAGCSVSRPCLEYAIVREKEGVGGGATQRERRSIIRRRRRAAARQRSLLETEAPNGR